MMSDKKPDFISRYERNRKTRMEKVDNAPPELRDLYNSYGTSLVEQFIALGVVKPRHIRHLIEFTLDEFSPTRGSYTRQGIRTHVSDK